MSRCLLVAVLGATLVVGVASSSRAQYYHGGPGGSYSLPPDPCQVPCPPAPDGTIWVEDDVEPVPADQPTPPQPDSLAPSPSTEPAPFDISAGETFGATGGDTFATSGASMDGFAGYIDNAIVRSQLRVRYDAGNNISTPDRAEFFYPQCGCFTGNGPGPGRLGEAETNVDYQDVQAYMECAVGPRFSGFLEVPLRAIDPEVNDNTAGLGDLNAGFKYAMLAYPDEYLTFQLRVYAPTGDGERGLGTGHASLEPALLYFRRNGRTTLFGEFRGWIPFSDDNVDGVDYAGEVLRYGLGVGYDIYDFETPTTVQRLTPIFEVVGWSVLDGLVFNGNRPTPDLPGTLEAADTTIVNLKLGVRYTHNMGSLYLGYGRAVTGTEWYEDITRLEYQRTF